MQNLLRNTLLDYLLSETIKEVLCQMASDDELPSDLTRLDASLILDKVKKSLAADEMFRINNIVSKLEEFLYVENIPADKQYEALLNADENDITGWVEGVEMLERYETSFTVGDLLELVEE